MSCMCPDCISTFLKALVAKVVEEVREEKEEQEKELWKRESEASDV